MEPTTSDNPLTCPTCGANEFVSLEVGFPFRVRLEECQRCKTRLRSVGQAEESFAVVQVGTAYSNLTSLLTGFRFSREELLDPDLPIYSDDELIVFGKGELPEDLIAPDDVVDLPYEMDDDETLLLQLPNVYMWEDRLHPDMAVLRLPHAVEPGGWSKLKGLAEPKYAHQVETLTNGTLSITTRRVIFHSEAKVWSQAYAKDARILPFPDGLGLTNPDRNRIGYFKGNYHWPLIFAVVRGAAVSVPAKPRSNTH